MISICVADRVTSFIKLRHSARKDKTLLNRLKDNAACSERKVIKDVVAERENVGEDQVMRGEKRKRSSGSE